MTGVFEGTGTVYFDTVKLVPRNSEKYEYDSRKNYVTLSEDPLGYQSSSTYNEDIGVRESFTDAEGNTTSYYYDDLNRLDEVEAPLGSSAYYDYDEVSNLNETRDPRSASRADDNYLTLYGYTEIDQLDNLTDPLDRSTSSTYDRCGNLTGVTLPNGMQTSYTYDDANRLIRKTLHDGKYFDYTYDDANYLISVTDQDSNSCTYNYDRAGRVLYSIDSFGRRLDYEWDKSHNLIEEKSSINDYVRYDYRGDNKLSRVKFPDYHADRYYRYDDSGRVFQIRHPYYYDDEPAFTNYSYYGNGWLQRITRTGRGSFYYEYYDNGNIKKIISGAGTEIFTYDDNGRLDTWTLNGVTKNYYYDEAGNLSDEENRDFTYNSANQITNQGFTYDQNGNLTSDGTLIYAYNSENQLVEVRRVSDNSLVATYSYNYNGLRKGKTVYSGQGSSTAEYHWDALGRLESESGSASFNKRYLYDNNGNMVAMEGGDTYEVHTNLRGDVVAITDEEDGGTVASYRYDPWGNVTYEYSNLYFEDQPFRYAGYYYDFETGLYYCNSRYYSPTLGRFLTKDGYSYISYSDPQSLNLYTYCGNDPVRMVDPNGRNGYAAEWTLELNLEEFLAAAGTVAARAAGVAGGFILVFSNPADAGELPEEMPANKRLNDFPANPDDWIPPEGVTETKSGDITGGKHRQWKDVDGNIVRRWDRGVPGENGWRETDHWHDQSDNHIPPNR